MMKKELYKILVDYIPDPYQKECMKEILNLVSERTKKCIPKYDKILQNWGAYGYEKKLIKNLKKEGLLKEKNYE